MEDVNFTKGWREFVLKMMRKINFFFFFLKGQCEKDENAFFTRPYKDFFSKYPASAL